MLTFAKCFKNVEAGDINEHPMDEFQSHVRYHIKNHSYFSRYKYNMHHIGVDDGFFTLKSDFLQPTSQNCHHQKVTNHLRTVSWVNLEIYQKLKYVIVFSVSSLYSIVTKCFNQKMNCSKSIRNRHLISKLIDRTWRFGCNDSIIDIISRWLSLINSPRCTFSNRFQNVGWSKRTERNPLSPTWAQFGITGCPKRESKHKLVIIYHLNRVLNNKKNSSGSSPAERQDRIAI